MTAQKVEEQKWGPQMDGTKLKRNRRNRGKPKRATTNPPSILNEEGRGGDSQQLRRGLKEKITKERQKREKRKDKWKDGEKQEKKYSYL
jgi:hypothetical protein